MRNAFCLILVTLLLGSCSNRIEYKAEDFQKEQQEYEKRKTELEASKGKFYNENKDALKQLAQNVSFALDTANKFEDASEDTLFYYDEAMLVPTNLGFITEKREVETEVKAAFFNRRISGDNRALFNNPFEELLTCYSNNIDCIQMKQDDLAKLLEIKYAFIIDDLLNLAPTIKGEEFEGGVYMARAICFDLTTKQPLLSFYFTATNSETVQVNSNFGQSGEREILNDYRKNIKKALIEKCQQHFLFPIKIAII